MNVHCKCYNCGDDVINANYCEKCAPRPMIFKQLYGFVFNIAEYERRCIMDLRNFLNKSHGSFDSTWDKLHASLLEMYKDKPFTNDDLDRCVRLTPELEFASDVTLTKIVTVLMEDKLIDKIGDKYVVLSKEADHDEH